MFKRASILDGVLLSLAVIFLTANPYFLYGSINLFELGIYLPGIGAILDGLIPYRDFFHLRGPLELYLPAFLMHFLGEKVSVLMAFFYFGNVLTLVGWVWVARHILKHRIFLYLLTFVLTARTFPRVVFTYWGGLRFALGAFALFCFIRYTQKEKRRWLFAGGLCTGLAGLTSIDTGFCALAAIIFAMGSSFFFQKRNPREMMGRVLIFLSGTGMVVIPFFIYLHVHQAFFPYWEAVSQVMLNMEKAFPVSALAGTPRNLGEGLLAMINPAGKSFKHMTPAYFYILLVIYLGFLVRRRRWEARQGGMLALGLYGLLMYILAFRNIEASQFEMALQPEKILLFVLLEEAYVWLKEKKFHLPLKFNIPWRQVSISAVLLGIVICSSLGYAVQRLHHRFWSCKYVMNKFTGRDTRFLQPFMDVPHQRLDLTRIGPLVVPRQQADDIIQMTDLIERNSQPQDKVLFFDELGIYHFLVDRPFISRFPMVIFSWMSDSWHEELMRELEKDPPQLAVLDNNRGSWFEDTYFTVPANKNKYDEVRNYIAAHYTLVKTTPSLAVYQRR